MKRYTVAVQLRHSLLAPAFALMACGSSSAPPHEPPSQDPEPVAAEGPAEGTTEPTVPSPSTCPTLERGVTEAARALSVCAEDDECVVLEVSLCDFPGLGCYFHAASRSRDAEALTRAIRDFESAGCPAAECDCEPPPTAARCVDGSCVAP